MLNPKSAKVQLFISIFRSRHSVRVSASWFPVAGYIVFRFNVISVTAEVIYHE